LSLAPPRPGSVIRYAYLWADEDAVGREEGRKDRPVLVLAATTAAEAAIRLLVLAITHAPPRSPVDAVFLPPEVCRRIGLDADPAWVVTTEANTFAWPGPDIRPVPRRQPRTVIYGQIPENLLRQVARSFLASRDRQRSRMVTRTE
jgi:hypothetical protein